MHITLLSSICGAEVTGLDCGGDLDDRDMKALRQALLDHCLLVFRDQSLSPEQHESFSRRWGPLKGHVLTQYLLPDHPYVLVISNKKDDHGNPVGIEDAGRYWHTDVSYEAVPPMGSLLYGLEVPKNGGDTLFANQYAAYENLPADLKTKALSLKARHRFNYAQIQETEESNRIPLTDEQQTQLVGAVHPVVRTHPDSKRKALYINPGFTQEIVDVDEQESRDLLDSLFGYATHDSVIYRHTWQPHDLVFWDNRCLMHHATPYPAEAVRHMHRTTVVGTAPE